MAECKTTLLHESLATLPQSGVIDIELSLEFAQSTVFFHFLCSAPPAPLLVSPGSTLLSSHELPSQGLLLRNGPTTTSGDKTQIWTAPGAPLGLPVNVLSEQVSLPESTLNLPSLTWLSWVDR